MMLKKVAILIFSICMTTAMAQTGQGYDLWLGYLKIEDSETLEKYRKATTSIYFENEGDILEAAQKEADRGLKSMLDQVPVFTETFESSNSMVVAKRSVVPTRLAISLPTEAGATLGPLRMRGTLTPPS